MEKKTLREKACELDEMTRSVTTDEAELLDLVLGKMKKGTRVPREDVQAIEEMYLRYFNPDGDEELEEDEDVEEDGIDEADIV